MPSNAHTRFLFWFCQYSTLTKLTGGTWLGHNRRGVTYLLPLLFCFYLKYLYRFKALVGIQNVSLQLNNSIKPNRFTTIFAKYFLKKSSK